LAVLRAIEVPCVPQPVLAIASALFVRLFEAPAPNDGSALFVRSGRKPSATPPVRFGERLYGAPNARHGMSSNVGDDHGRRVRDRRVIAPSRAERRRSYTLS
jgi:hypothetical protein